MSKIANRKSQIRIAVIGPGGIGCLFAGLLAEAGHEVHLVDRRPDRAALIARQGLLIERDGKTRQIRLYASAHPTETGLVALVVLCVKAHETAGTIPSILAMADPKTIILSLQNGIGNMEALGSVVENKNLFAGVTMHGATVIGLNHVRHAGTGPTLVGAIDQNDAAAKNLAEILTAAGIESSAAADTAAMLWSKLIINAAICPVSVLANLTNGELAATEKWRSLMEKAAKEGAQVAAARGIKLIYEDPAKAVLEVCKKTSANISSMLQDVRRGRNTEIMQINGAIVNAAAELGIDVPTNMMLYQSVLDSKNFLNKHAAKGG